VSTCAAQADTESQPTMVKMIDRTSAKGSRSSGYAARRFFFVA
jgi:hypothetical protein